MPHERHHSKRRPKVLLACPNGDAWIHKLVVFALIRTMQDPRAETQLILPTHKPYVNNLHLIVQDFLAGPFDYLVSMDDDNPPLGNLIDLVLLDLDVIGCPTPVWHCDTKNAPNDRPFYFNALREVEEPDGSVGFKPLDSEPGFKPVGIKRADAVGTGCVVIARRVLEELVKRARDEGPLETPFMRRWDERGIVQMGNDYAFCQRVRRAGFEVWAHFDYTCQHFNELELTEAINALMRFRLER